MRRERPERKHIEHPKPDVTSTQEWSVWDYLEETLSATEEAAELVKECKDLLLEVKERVTAGA